MRKTTEADLDRHPELERLEGYLWRREGARLAFLAARVPEGQCIVELGSNRGKSACFLAAGSKAGARVPVHCVDLWTDGGQRAEYGHLGFADQRTKDTFDRQIAETRVKGMIVEHQGDTVTTGEQWTGPPVGLLHVDADHHYESVRADTLAWLPHLAPGAWICWHDYTKHEPTCTQFDGVVRFVDEFLTAGSAADASRAGRLVSARLP